MLKRFSILLLLMACLPLCGCKKDTEINAIVAELDTFTMELVKKIESAPNPSAGVDDAQRYLDSKKADLTAKMTTLKAIRGYQASAETKAKMIKSIFDDATRVGSLKVKYMSASRDKAFKAKLDKLIKDYTDLIKM